MTRTYVDAGVLIAAVRSTNALSSHAFVLFRWLVGGCSPQPRLTTMALLGLGAALVSIALDAVTVIPIIQMALSEYIVQIVSLYLLIISMSVAAGMRQNEREDTRAIA